MKKLIPQKIKNIYHLLRSVLAAIYFGFPAKRIKVIGITGTNGKTTTTQMAVAILEQAGYKVAVSSTINFKIGEKTWVNKSKLTTPDAWKNQKFIKDAVKQECDYLVMEVASHALDQHRLWGMKFDVAAITNVTREHLDYHKTMKEYRLAKKNLFQMLKKRASVVVNLDMEKPAEFLETCSNCKRYGYSLKEENNFAQLTEKIVAKEVKLGLKSSGFKVNNQEFKLNLVGGFNVENALAAISIGLSQKVKLSSMAKALERITKVPGRMDYIENERGLNIIIDYALTPDSMEKLGRLMKENLKNTEHKLIWVFGACGDRDRGKRPLMGEIVSHYADYALVTNEDPYTEDPQQIIEEVYAGVDLPEGEKSWKIAEREDAFKKALQLAKKGDIILITGKGAEETMRIGTRDIEWNDRRVMERLLGANRLLD